MSDDVKGLVERLVGCVPFDHADSQAIQAAALALSTLSRERDEARAYLKAFCRACIEDDHDRHAAGVHEANPTFGWYFQCEEITETNAPDRCLTGGQVRRAMEIVGFDKLKIDPPTRTIAEELHEHREAKLAAEASSASKDERIAALETALAEAQASEAYQRGKAEACQRVTDRHRARATLNPETPDV